MLWRLARWIGRTVQGSAFRSVGGRVPHGLAKAQVMASLGSQGGGKFVKRGGHGGSLLLAGMRRRV